MRTLPMIAALLGLFVGGAAVGGWLAATLAPDSWLAEAVSFFALPVAFAISLQAWYGLALLGLAARLVGLRSGPADADTRTAAPLSGTFVFLPVSSVFGAVTGLVVGLVSSTHPAWLVTLVYWGAGTLHGTLGWRLARAGVLMPPEMM